MSAIETDASPTPPEDETALERARALRARGDSELVFVQGRPSLLDRVEARTLVPVTLAVVGVALVELDAARNPSPLDALDLALRMVAFAATVRAALEVIRAVRRHRAIEAHRDDAVVLLDDALVVLAPSGDAVVPRDHVAGVHGGRTRDGDEELVLFVRPPSVPSLRRLPGSTHTPASVAARRIARWAGLEDETEPSPPGRPTRRTPAEDYDRIARGEVRPGEVRIPTGYAWLERGPYAAAAFVVVLVERLLHLPPGTSLDPVVIALAVACLALPIGWLALGLRAVRVGGGAAMVCTDDELLVRDANGVHRVPYADLADVRLTTTRSWTLLSGASTERVLVVERADHAALRFDERRLGVSAACVRALLDAYGRGAMAASGTPPSQGSGAGGGISGTDGTTT